MNLENFIAETLSQIAAGVRSADLKLKDYDAAVNPKNVSVDAGGKAAYGTYVPHAHEHAYAPTVRLIEFDVVVTASEGAESKGGIGIHVGALGIGSTAKSDRANGSESRIRFSIPLMLPNSKHH